MSTSRELFGVIGKIPNLSEEKKYWNTLFKEKGIDAFFDSYPTTETNLPERLSEMFHFDRRGYIVGEPLQEVIIPLLDGLDTTAKEQGRVNMIVNQRGVFVGFFIDTRNEVEGIWFEK